MSRKRRDEASVARRRLVASNARQTDTAASPAAVLRVVEEPTVDPPPQRAEIRLAITSSVEGVQALGLYADAVLVLVAILPFAKPNDSTLWMHLAKNGDSYRHRIRVELEGDTNWAEKVAGLLEEADYDVAIFEYAPAEAHETELGNAG